VTTRKSERRKKVCHEDNEINVLATVNGNPQICEDYLTICEYRCTHTHTHTRARARLF